MQSGRMTTRRTGGSATPALRRRRWSRIVLVIVGFAVVLAAIAWYSWLPEYRPELRTGEVYGVDVSAHQGPIQWSLVAADGIKFAYIKATEGNDFLDRRFAENWRAAQHAGLRRGAYHFFTLCSSGDQQAAQFLSAIGGRDGSSLAPAVDLEFLGACRQRPTADDFAHELRAFVRIVEARFAERLVLYVGDSFEARYHVARILDRPRWRLRWLRRPEQPWLVWQVSGRAYVNGIHGNVDLDVGRIPFR